MHRILIVEDEEAYSTILQAELSRRYDVTVANTGKSGLLAATALAPDLILLDIGLPRMNGLTLLRQLRQHDSGNQTKVMLLTNLEANTKIIRQVTRDLPLYYFVKCDTSMHTLLDKIDEALHRPIGRTVAGVR